MGDFNITTDGPFDGGPTRIYAERADGTTVGTESGHSSDEVDPRKLMKEPHINDLRWLYRESFASTLVNKPVEDAFKNGFEIGDNDLGAERILSEHDYIDQYVLGEQKARRDGFALLFFVLDDTAETAAADPMDITVNGVEGINVLTVDDLARTRGSAHREDIPLEREEYEVRETGIVVDTRVGEPTYEEPIGYLVGPDDYARNADSVEFVHKNRVQHLTWNPQVDGDLDDRTLGQYEGDSVLLSSYQLLRGLQKGNWSVMQTLFRYASKMHHVQLPEDATEEDMDEAEDMVQNLNAMSELLTPAGYEIESHGTDGQLEPRDYFDVVFDQICASNEMTKSVLFGTQTGTVSGSETDIKNYFNKVSRFQKRRASFFIKDFVGMYTALVDDRYGAAFQPDFEIDWNPLFELDELDKAEVLRTKTNTLKMAIDGFMLTPAEARSVLNEEWADLELDALSAEEVEFLESLNLHQVGQETTEERVAAKEEAMGNPQMQNGGGMPEGEQTAAANPTADSGDALMSSVPSGAGVAPSRSSAPPATIVTDATQSSDDVAESEYVDTPEGRGLVFEHDGDSYTAALVDGGAVTVEDGEIVERTETVDSNLPDGWDRKDLLDWWQSVDTDVDEASTLLAKERDVSEDRAEEAARLYRDHALGGER